ncbi:polysaccharide deacetylase family protein [Aneurinibacillus sp. Ricciae_BoGa-3]|uniref:polysaccharide deacetylase family protein n=1 Tax=Aneurinibacillus sp. Ricciae_BoGa-3 TaxID=3022697 RepID=UPI00233F8D57|nr:polysaccharide deacetylase family protein [Aneurinibacillus sp. Ricciae_BoGa-3]WCK52922.1 polysaccharide deacetylase family protein [Aneurinibacillus sp. Ricciae_BoGa-3]
MTQNMKFVFSGLLALCMLTGCSNTYIPKDKEVNAPAKITPKVTSFGYPIFPDKPYEKTTMDTTVPGVAVLMYHHFLEPKENKKFRNNAAVITPEQFAAQMKILYDNNYQVIQLPTLEQYVTRKIKLPARCVVLTFDDGYESNFRYAAPVLRHYHYKATLFLMTGSMHQKPDAFNPDKLNHVSWTELPKYSDVFDYQPHAHKFHRLMGKKSWFVAQPLSAVKNDIHTAKELTHGQYIAYPYGQYNPYTINILKQEGLHLAFTTHAGKVYPGSPIYELPRYGVYPYTSLKEFKKIIGLIVNRINDKYHVASKQVPA